MMREKSYKNPGAPSTAALLANASGRPDFFIFYLLNTTPLWWRRHSPPRKGGESILFPEKSWLPERDNRISPHPVTYQRQVPSGLPPYMGHSLTGERFMGERLLDGSQLFSGSFAALRNDCGVAILNAYPVMDVAPQLFNILVTPGADPGSTPGYRVKSGMTRGA